MYIIYGYRFALDRHRRTVGYFGVPDHNNTFYPMFHGNIYLFGTWGLSLNMWMSNFEEGALWLLVWGVFLCYY